MAPQETESKPYYELRLHKRFELISNTPRKLNSITGELKAKNGAKWGSLNLAPNERPICAILGWFAARKQVLMKFARLYLDQGMDVLIVTTPPDTIFTPASSTKKAARMFITFFANNKEYEYILIHGFSIGAMGWGQFLRYVNRYPELCEFFHQKIKGQIWDSPFTDKRRLPYVGSSTVCPNEPELQKILEAYVRFHINTFKSPGSNFYKSAFEAFKCMNFNVPYLLYTSEDDSAALCKTVAGCAQEWKSNGNTVYWKAWKSSVHVCHMKEHPEEYKALLLAFLSKIGVLEGSLPDVTQVAAPSP